MSDLISRQDAIDAIMSVSIPLIAFGKTAKIYLNVKQDAVRQIEAIPSADRPKGHIVTKCNGKFNPTVWAECSECEKPIDAWDKFCKHCGAKMGGA